MPFSPRGLTTISQSVRGAFRQYLPGTDAAIRQNVNYVLGKVIALLAREYELRLEWLYKQLFLSTATDLEHIRIHTADYRIYQKPAAAASGAIIGAGAASTTYPAGVRWYSGGVTFVSTAPFTSDGAGAWTASVRAEQTGATTNRSADAVMTLADASLYPTLVSQALVSAAGLGGGADTEGKESLRQRGLDRKARPPQGGALPDYEQFARDVPGVLKAWAWQFTNGIGSIAVYFLFDGRPNSIPTSADVEAVQAAIDARRLIRVDDAVAIAPIASSVDITITDLSVDTAEVRAAIEGNLIELFAERARPGIASDPFVLPVAWISESISTATGEDRHTLTMPASDLTFTNGHIPVLGDVTYA